MSQFLLLMSMSWDFCWRWVVVRGGWSLTFGSYVTLANPSENLFPITRPPLPLHFNRLNLLTPLLDFSADVNKFFFAKVFLEEDINEYDFGRVLKTRSKMFFRKTSYQCFPQTTNLSWVNTSWTYATHKESPNIKYEVCSSKYNTPTMWLLLRY